MSDIRLVPASPAHVGRIANRMRADDVLEVAAYGRSPKQALRLGIRASIGCYTVMIDGKPEGMMGLFPANALEREGKPWMLGTDELYGHPRAWLELMPQILRQWRDSSGLKHLRNHIGRANVRAIRLLRRLGFEIGDEPILIGGVEFVTFAMRD